MIPIIFRTRFLLNWIPLYKKDSETYVCNALVRPTSPRSRCFRRKIGLPVYIFYSSTDTPIFYISCRSRAKLAEFRAPVSFPRPFAVFQSWEHQWLRHNPWARRKRLKIRLPGRYLKPTFFLLVCSWAIKGSANMWGSVGYTSWLETYVNKVHDRVYI